MWKRGCILILCVDNDCLFFFRPTGDVVFDYCMLDYSQGLGQYAFAFEKEA